MAQPANPGRAAHGAMGGRVGTRKQAARLRQYMDILTRHPYLNDRQLGRLMTPCAGTSTITRYRRLLDDAAAARRTDRAIRAAALWPDDIAVYATRDRSP